MKIGQRSCGNRGAFFSAARQVPNSFGAALQDFLSIGAPLPQNLHRLISIDQFATPGLCKALGYVGGHFLPLNEHPVFKIELLADDLKGLSRTSSRSR